MSKLKVVELVLSIMSALVSAAKAIVKFINYISTSKEEPEESIC